MSDYLIYVRKNNGICEKFMVNPNSMVVELKMKVSDTTRIPIPDLQLYYKDIKLDNSYDSLTIKQSSLPNNAILLISAPGCEKLELDFEFQGRSFRQKVDNNQTIANMREIAASLFEVDSKGIQFQIRGTKIFNDSVRLSELELNNGEKVLIKNRKKITNLLGNNQENTAEKDLFNKNPNSRMKIVESIASSEQLSEQKFTFEEQSPIRRQYRSDIIRQKSSPLTSSLKKIEPQNQIMTKHSMIVSANPCSQFLNSPHMLRHNKLNNLNEIKETMSYGSLEEQEVKQIEVELFNPDHTKYYKMICMPECLGSQIRDKLSKVERVSPVNIQIENLEDKSYISDVLMKREEQKRVLRTLQYNDHISSHSGSSKKAKRIKLIFQVIKNMD